MNPHVQETFAGAGDLVNVLSNAVVGRDQRMLPVLLLMGGEPLPLFESSSIRKVRMRCMRGKQRLVVVPPRQHKMFIDSPLCIDGHKSLYMFPV